MCKFTSYLMNIPVKVLNCFLKNNPGLWSNKFVEKPDYVTQSLPPPCHIADTVLVSPHGFRGYFKCARLFYTSGPLWVFYDTFLFLFINLVNSFQISFRYYYLRKVSFFCHPLLLSTLGLSFSLCCFLNVSFWRPKMMPSVFLTPETQPGPQQAIIRYLLNKGILKGS